MPSSKTASLVSHDGTGHQTHLGFLSLIGIDGGGIHPVRLLEELHQINAKAHVALSEAALQFVVSCFEGDPSQLDEAIPDRLLNHVWIQAQKRALHTRGLDLFLNLTAMSAPKECLRSLHDESSASSHRSSTTCGTNRIYTDPSLSERSVLYDSSHASPSHDSPSETPLSSIGPTWEQSRRGSKDFIQRKSSLMLSPVAELTGEWSLDAVVAKAEVEAAVAYSEAEAQIQMNQMNRSGEAHPTGARSLSRSFPSLLSTGAPGSDPSSLSSPYSSGEMLAEWLDRIERELESEQQRKIEQQLLDDDVDNDGDNDDAEEENLRRAEATRVLRLLESGEMNSAEMDKWWMQMEIDRLESLTTLTLERKGSDRSNFSSEESPLGSQKSNESSGVTEAWPEEKRSVSIGKKAGASGFGVGGWGEGPAGPAAGRPPSRGRV